VVDQAGDHGDAEAMRGEHDCVTPLRRAWQKTSNFANSLM